MQVGVEPGAPHTLCGLKHTLLGRLARPSHDRALRATPTTTTTTTTNTTTIVSTRRRIATSTLIQKTMNPKARLLAHNVCIICGRHEADGLGGARVQVRCGVHALLHRVGRERALVVDDDVVRRLDGALQTLVRLQVKVKVEHGRHALVDDRAGSRVAVAVGEFRIGRVEPRVVPFAADDDTQRRVVPRVLGVDALERFEDLGQLLLDHLVVLALSSSLKEERED